MDEVLCVTDGFSGWGCLEWNGLLLLLVLVLLDIIHTPTTSNIHSKQINNE